MHQLVLFLFEGKYKNYHKFRGTVFIGPPCIFDLRNITFGPKMSRKCITLCYRGA